MKSTFNLSAVLASIFAVMSTMQPVRGETIYPAIFPDGAKSLFAGHSFFVPIAGSFNQLAIQNGYSSHDMQSVFSGGPGGSPRQLWENEDKRNEIIDILATGEIELFGLTSFSQDTSRFEDYQQWFDVALSYNPDTVFFIGNPFVAAGPRLATAAYDDAIENNGNLNFETVQLLREAYPDNVVSFLNYGKTASIMKREFEAGELPDILGLVPDPTNGVELAEALFADNTLGHAGPMLTEVSALSWMSALYGADVSQLSYTNYQSDVESIVNEVLAFNTQYQTAAVPEPAALSLVALAILPALIRLRLVGSTRANPPS